MGRKLIIAMAVLSFAFAGMTFAAVENVKVSGDITAQAITRSLDLGDSSKVDSLSGLFSQIRLRVDADLTEGVSAVISLLNERIWGEEDAGNGDGSTELTLDLGYIELKEFIYDPLTLIVGRQNLRFGNALIIGDPDTNRTASSEVPTAIADLSVRKSFDAVRGILDFAPWTIDLFYVKVDENDLVADDDETMIGINAAYDWSSYNGVTELYVVNVDGSSLKNTQVAEDEDNTLTVGARVQFDPSDNLTLGMEAAHQSGDYYDGANTFHRDAWATQVAGEYKFLNDYNTKLGVSYTYLTGEDADGSDDNTYKAWDPIYESQTPGEILNILLTNSNAQFISASASYMPKEDITLALVYTYARLNEQLSTLSDASSTYTYTMNDKKDFGNEVDVCALYDYTEDVQLSLNAGWFMPGDAFDNSNDNTAYSVRGGINVGF